MSRCLVYLQMSLCSCEFARYRWRRPHGRGGPQQAMSRPHGVHLFRLRLVEDTSWCLVGHPTNLPKSGNLFRVRLCLGDQPNHMVCIHILAQKHCVNIRCVKSGKWHNYFLPLEKANIILNGKSAKPFFFIYREFFCYECRLLCKMLLVWPNIYQDTCIHFLLQRYRKGKRTAEGLDEVWDFTSCASFSALKRKRESSAVAVVETSNETSNET